MKIVTFRIMILLLFLIQSNVQAQVYQVYESRNLNFYSTFWNDSLYCKLSVPYSLYAAEDQVKYPILILLDQQNATSFDYHLRTINYLTGVGAQIPEMIVVGVPLKPDTRLYFTDLQTKELDSLTGMERSAKMIFEELLPKIKSQYPSSDFLLIAGHSRTAYLVNYLLANHSNSLDVAAAFSGFYEDSLTQSQIIALAEGKTNPNRKRHSYYLSAGTSFEEQSYLKEYDEMADLLESGKLAPEFRWKYFVNEHTNHIANYGMSLGPMLVDQFSDYNMILGRWFEKQVDALSAEQARDSLLADFAQLRCPVAPQILHINSVASAYYSKQDYVTAELLIDVGMHYYPKDAGLSLFKADLMLMQEKNDEAKRYLQAAKQLLESQGFLTLEETNELWDWYAGLLENLQQTAGADNKKEVNQH